MITALDKNFQPVKPLNKIIVLMWERKYYECGKFTLTMPITEYDKSIKYLYSQVNTETGIVQSVSFQDDIVQLGGFFLEKILDDKIIHPVFNYNGNIELCARQLITIYKEDIPLLNLGKAANLGTTVQMQETGEELGKRIYKLYETQQMSYRLNYDYVQNKIFFETYKGRDLTQAQNVNPWVAFSKNRNNVLSSNIIIDESNFKNYAIVAGGEEGVNRKYVVVDRSGGGYRKKIFIDARDLQQGDKTAQEYNSELRQRGEEKLLEFAKIEQFGFNLSDTEAIRYKVDFDIGDKVDVVIQDVSFEFSARITSITETIKENMRSVSMVVGEQIPTTYKKIKMGVR